MRAILVFLVFVSNMSVLLEAKNYGPKHDRLARLDLENYACEIAQRFQLTVLKCGVGILADADKGLWAISFTSDQQLTVEEGRQLTSQLCRELFSKIFHGPAFKKYCRIEDIEMKEEFVAFRLAFWDCNVNRPLYPYLAQIRLADGYIYYHYADPETQRLQEPVIEPLPCLDLPRACL